MKKLVYGSSRIAEKREVNAVWNSIRFLWEAIESADPDISTESLFAMIEDTYNKGKPEKCWIDAGDISDAMAPWNNPEEEK